MFCINIKSSCFSPSVKLREQHNRDLDVVKEGYEMKLREKEEVLYLCGSILRSPECG